ncbi:hypothetical protein DFP72DRAFT_857107 [Ephemerocybe angulata]|uniref:DUF6533 domain-containing protein n=1 Tax=Ephemerocybe angulata TaxID=980116 RepID=A0A8H6HD16_9AGAR|nr:hypothetical protein DFP72DRAFT_857107 [Tulosesus angulatus]
MSLTPEEISEIISTFSGSLTLEYIFVGFYTFFFYYYATTVAMEVKLMWPRKWHWGKVLFLANRYLPMLTYIANLSSGWQLASFYTSHAEAFIARFRVYIILSPKACAVLVKIFTIAHYRVYGFSAEMTAIRQGLTLGANLIQISYFSEGLRTLPLSELDRELGYACTWAQRVSPVSSNKNAIAGYISLAKAVYVPWHSSFFWCGYRKRAGTFGLFHVLRRDSGVYILSLAVPLAIRLGAAVVGAFQLRLGWMSLPGHILDLLNCAVVPVLANRLLLNMWKTEDPDVRKTVSSILFDPPRPGEDSDDDDEEFGDRPIEIVRYEGLGRRRAPARGGTEGASLGGAGATQAAENGDAV